MVLIVSKFGLNAPISVNQRYRISRFAQTSSKEIDIYNHQQVVEKLKIRKLFMKRWEALKLKFKLKH
jgi:hypothetical protein